MEICYSCNDQFSWAYNGIGETQEVCKSYWMGCTKETQNLEILSESISRYSVCHFLLCSKMEDEEVLHV